MSITAKTNNISQKSVRGPPKIEVSALLVQLISRDGVIGDNI